MNDKVNISAVRRCACANIRRADRVMTQFYDEALSSSGLYTTQFTLLATIGEAAPVAVNRLAEIMVMDRTTLTRNLGPLTKQQLVRIETGEDRRVRLITLTPEGEEALRRAWPLWREAQSHVEHTMGQERFDDLLTQLSAVMASTG
jgi:DNA-binding MarR family transcriptional regulator